MRLRWPRLLRLWQRVLAPRLRRGPFRDDVSSWASQGVDLVARRGIESIAFERDGIWVGDGQGLAWRYTPFVFGSAVWAEFGVRHEQKELELLADRLGPGNVFVDVGANIGWHSVRLAKAVDGLRVIAFEPVPETFSTLLANIDRNGVGEQVEARQHALGDAEGTARMSRMLQLGNFVVPPGQVASAEATVEVQVRRLDDALEDLDRLDAIKCDVEGAELAVLQGARGLLERRRPLLMVELDERWAARYGHTSQTVVDMLEELGYRGEQMAGGTNFLFVPVA